MESTEQQVYELLKKDPTLKREEISHQISKTVRTVQRSLDPLRDKGYIECKGSKKEGVEVMEKGYIQLYTGNGKGKTTAALGLSIRCLCAGGTVFFGQFMKGQKYSELKTQLVFDGLKMEQFVNTDFIKRESSRSIA